jgi:hypothetical protein
MNHDSSEYRIEARDDGRIDITNQMIRGEFTEGVTLYPSEVEVFIKRLREVAHEMHETRPLD